MNREDMEQLSLSELSTRTQTNVTPSAIEGFEIAQYAYEQRAHNDIEKGRFARQAAFRAEQAMMPPSVVEEWLDNSRQALSANSPFVRRELIATELLSGRGAALRIERLGQKTLELTNMADSSFASGESILKEQHEFGEAWDRFGTILSGYRATYEAMNGSALFALTTTARGIWRALRARSEDTPKAHTAFVIKHLGMHAVNGAALISTKPLESFQSVSRFRHKVAQWLLGRGA